MSFNVCDYGAVADGVSLNTAAIQAALDACAAVGGGCVTVPSGVYKCGTLWLRSRVELHLESGAVLLASDNLEDYNAEDAYEQNWGCPSEDWQGKHLIIAHEAEGCAISGRGTVDGNCHAFVEKDCDYSTYQNGYNWSNGKSRLRNPAQPRPGQLICFIECREVAVQDITIRNSPCWSCFLHGCEYVQVRGVRVHNPLWMLNSDGIDIDTCRCVTVSDCIIETGDDAITLRASTRRLKNKALCCEHVTVTNCVLYTGVCAFRIGVGDGLIRHARISNITVRKCRNLVQFCTAYLKSGGVNIEDVNVSNVSAVDTDRCVEAFARNGAYIRNVTLENIRSTSAMMNYLDGTDGCIENVTLRNIELNVFDRYAPMTESLLAQRGEHLLALTDTANVTLDRVTIHGRLCDGECPTVATNSEGLTLVDCNFDM